MKGDPSDCRNWFALARRDLEKARKDLTQGETPYAVIQLQQAAEKACKGSLIAGGWDLIKTHDLVFLLDELKKRNVVLEWFAEPAALLSKEYFEERYVSWQAEPALTTAEANELLAAVERLFTDLKIA